MLSHERFWTEFLVAPSSFKSYIPFPQHVRHAGIAKLEQVYFSFVTCHIMTVMANLTWLTQTGVMLNPWRVWSPCKRRTLHIKTSLFHPVVIIIGHAECWMLQEWVHEGERCTTFNWLVIFLFTYTITPPHSTAYALQLNQCLAEESWYGLVDKVHANKGWNPTVTSEESEWQPYSQMVFRNWGACHCVGVFSPGPMVIRSCIIRSYCPVSYVGKLSVNLTHQEPPRSHQEQVFRV